MPSAAYGAAAAQPGTWNKMPDGFGTALVGLGGAATGASVSALGANFAFWANNPGTAGDDELLMDDACDGARIYTFTGLAPGNYTLYALAGLRDNSKSPPKFTAYAIGVTQGVAVAPGETRENVFINMDVTLEHAFTLDVTGPTPTQRGPDRLQATLAIAVGSQEGAEEEVLGWLATEALIAAGADVSTDIPVGDVQATREAELAGLVDLYWETTATGWLALLREIGPSSDAQQLYEDVRDEDLEENAIVWLPPAPAEGGRGIVANPDTMEELVELPCGRALPAAGLGLVEGEEGALNGAPGRTDLRLSGQVRPPPVQLLRPEYPEANVPIVDREDRLQVAGQTLVEPARRAGHAVRMTS